MEVQRKKRGETVLLKKWSIVYQIDLITIPHATAATVNLGKTLGIVSLSLFRAIYL